MSDSRAATESLGAMLRLFVTFVLGQNRPIGAVTLCRTSINGHYEPLLAHPSCAKSRPPAPSSHTSESCSSPAFVGAPDLVSKLFRPAQQEIVQVVCHALCVRTSGGK
jgi:hypothetical protein